MVTQQKRSANGVEILTALPCYRNMLHIANNSEFELYLLDKHFETIVNKIGSFLPVWPLQSQNIDLLTFSSITTKWYVVDRSNYTFSESL